MFARWISGYFDHGDLSTRNPNILEWVLTSTSRPGTIYRMSKAEQDEILQFNGASVDIPCMQGLSAQLNAAYRKVLFTPEAMDLFSNMTVTYLTGEKGPAAQISQSWIIQDELPKQGVKTGVKMAPGINHFVHWDDPERAIDIFLECAQPK
ncbi:hypothetical protein CPB84DRAFT_1773626 [Gymnopilus junonius]|uniref:Alpha/beta hydrolase n=1 Tax=Gymnopilus junonius TaxID=109634 RepID=A0A9P5TQ30_GYMJU|nr:hypothetical protein CPB84DRAFT_1773626 [Gymnopilus junonius]